MVRVGQWILGNRVEIIQLGRRREGRGWEDVRNLGCALACGRVRVWVNGRRKRGPQGDGRGSWA